MRIFIILIIMMILSCSVTQNSINNSKMSTLEIISKLNIENSIDRKKIDEDLFKKDSNPDFTLFSYKKKNSSLPYLILKYTPSDKFISAVYFPTLESKKLNKEELFRVFVAHDWEKKEENLSEHDLTLKVMHLSKQKNVLFGFYEIKDRSIQFVYVGSESAPASFNDLFLF
jgi:L-rhamnose mutarotase